MNLHKVFVYGTLKKGEPNHSWFKEENGISNYLGKGTTVEKYPLIIGTKYNVPLLLFKPDTGHNVLGELYEIDDKMLFNLDILEDHPNFYERTLTDIRMDGTNEIVKCLTYFIMKFKPQLLEGEMFSCYSSSGPHNLPYCERYLRDKDYDLKSDLLQ